ncbi:AraC family transcriptional regulator [Arcobacter lacus]|uniref:AraC family transcriptional regulator n=1 Tax=Arcobacter lacus TaxID=1912876 RepID=A0ABX5JJD2_9BACT|nr:AraC family transcriptional regulator [Arcobacter lacus]PUE66777.1 AraC family transcriptional regulator [Arcobacter lacus]
MSFEKQRFELIEFIKSKYNFYGDITSEISNLDFYISKSKHISQSHIMYEPSICVILQGKKAVGFGNELYIYDKNKYLIASTHLPATVKILEASKDEPHISFKIKFTLEDIFEVLKNINNLNFKNKSEKGLFFGEQNERLYDAIYRLLKLLDKPKEDINYPSSLIIKEILYILMNDKAGYFLSKFAMENSISNKIVKVIEYIKENYAKKLNIKELASIFDISESSLYQNFKSITQITPIQFQKNLRLQESKRLFSLQNIDVLEVAILVGYESASQFSKDYSKMYGMTPKKHSIFLKS